LNDFVERFSERCKALWGEFQESQIFIRIKEKIDELPSAVQKGLLWGSAGLVIFIIISIPFSAYWSSTDFEDEFVETKDTIKDLLKLSRSGAGGENYEGPGPSFLRGRASTIFADAGLIPEQIEPTTEINSKGDSKLIPSSITQKGIQVNLKKLNLKQVLDIGHRLENIHPNVFLTGLDMVANSEDNHYYDVSYILVGFSVERPPPPPTKKGETILNATKTYPGCYWSFQIS